MASKQQVAIPEKHLRRISELKAALAADETCMVEPMRMAEPFWPRVDPMSHTYGKYGASMPVGACPPPQEKTEEGKMKHTTYTRSLIENLTPGHKVYFHDKQDWSGRLIGCYGPIEKGKSDRLHHMGAYVDPNGSKGAVVYAGKGVNNKDVAFLLAWHSTPYDDANNKVYVECGNLDDYNKINWGDIQKKLDATSEHRGYYRHDKTGAMLSADIDPTGVNPRLACIFDVLN